MIEASKDKNQSGTGLGLMISHKLSKKLTFEGGSGIVCKSEYGKGSTFTFVLENKIKFVEEE